jgi:hypothetical protein
MEEIHKFEHAPSYKHMKPRDVVLWDRFIDAFPDAYREVQYDFMVGDPPPFNPLMDDGEDWEQDKLYRLKIDCVCYDGNRFDIVEVKPEAGPSTIGQVKAYRELFLRDEQPQIPVGMVIVTDVERPNMRYLCEAEGVRLVVV